MNNRPRTRAWASYHMAHSDKYFTVIVSRKPEDIFNARMMRIPVTTVDIDKYIDEVKHGYVLYGGFASIVVDGGFNSGFNSGVTTPDEVRAEQKERLMKKWVKNRCFNEGRVVTVSEW